jgi:hypothetical protein
MAMTTMIRLSPPGGMPPEDLEDSWKLIQPSIKTKRPAPYPWHYSPLASHLLRLIEYLEGAVAAQGRVAWLDAPQVPPWTTSATFVLGDLGATCQWRESVEPLYGVGFKIVSFADWLRGPISIDIRWSTAKRPVVGLLLPNHQLVATYSTRPGHVRLTGPDRRGTKTFLTWRSDRDT